MKLIFEKSVAGRRCAILPACDVDPVELPEGFARTEAPSLPEMSETDISRHYSELCWCPWILCWNNGGPHRPSTQRM